MTERTAAEILSAYRDLENDICRAHNMSIILDDTLEAKIKKYNGRWVIDCGDENLEALAFAWKEVRDLTLRVKEHFYSIESEAAE